MLFFIYNNFWRKGWVHGDLTANNVYYHRPRLKVLDFECVEKKQGPFLIFSILIDLKHLLESFDAFLGEDSCFDDIVTYLDTSVSIHYDKPGASDEELQVAMDTLVRKFRRDKGETPCQLFQSMLRKVISHLSTSNRTRKRKETGAEGGAAEGGAAEGGAMKKRTRRE